MEGRSKTKVKKTRNTGKKPGVNFQYQFQPDYVKSKGEVNNEPSKTVPDMALSVNEILLNHTRGISSNIHHNEGEYFNAEVPRFDDITDMVEHKEQLAERLKEITETIKQENIIKKKAKADQKEKDRAEYLKSLIKPPEASQGSPEPKKEQSD